MREGRSRSVIVANAEVDSMGRSVDDGFCIDTKTPPQRAAIEKAQADLRQEYDVREERRRELEFLEKGGNPLEFKFVRSASVSVQSTSCMDQHPGQILTSEAKASFALTSSPHGDSVESSSRPGVPAVSEPNIADNLLLLVGDNESREGRRNSLHARRRNVAPSKQCSQMDGSRNAKKSEDSGIVCLVKNQAYVRRNRSRSNRDVARSSSGVRGSRESKVLTVEAILKDQSMSPSFNTKSRGSNVDMVYKTVTSYSQLDVEFDSSLTKDGDSERKLDVAALKILHNKQHQQQSEFNIQENPMDLTCDMPDFGGPKDQVASVDLRRQYSATVNTENHKSLTQLIGFSNLVRDIKGTFNDVTKVLDLESSCSQTSVSLGMNDSELCANTRDVDSNINSNKHVLGFESTTNLEDDEVLKAKNNAKTIEGPTIDGDLKSVHQKDSGNDVIFKAEDGMHDSRSVSENDARHAERSGLDDHMVSTNDAAVNLLHDDNDTQVGKENPCTGRPQDSTASVLCEPVKRKLSEWLSASSPKLNSSYEDHLKLKKREQEDSILHEARIIKAKRNRIAELSVGALPFKICPKSYWDFVIEEMTWLANDFVQERMWKITAAAQICHQVAFASQIRYEKLDLCGIQKKVAYSLAKVVMQFWHSIELLLYSDDQKEDRDDLFESKRTNENEACKGRVGICNMEKSYNLESQYRGPNLTLPVERYAVNFLRNNGPHVFIVQLEAPVTPDRVTNSGILEISCADCFTEENLFYTVPPGALVTYQKCVESHLVQCEKTGSSMHEEVEASMFDAGAGNAHEEDEGERSNYYLPTSADASKLLKFSPKKRNFFMRSLTAADMTHGHCIENRIGNQQFGLFVERTDNSLNGGSIRTKRMRTAGRQKVLSLFGAGSAGSARLLSKTDASSGDANSFEDDQSTLHGGSQVLTSLDVDSLYIEKQLPFDYTEISKPKKKKAKHLGFSYEQRWRLDSPDQNGLRAYLKRRSENQQFENNGNIGQHTVKKQRIIKESYDDSFDPQMIGSIPSPVDSQMSNLPYSNRFIKMIGGCNRGKKSKALKLTSGQLRSGSSWSSFEDQALVVLVHDMGPNWELVSDCFNGSLQLKCIFRKPKECKERHKILMEMTSGDGAEDSGSSQPYSSTLPGIPKGIARQLFQRLQGPVEEDTLKSHFQKIISISEQQHYWKNQCYKQESKKISPAHNSHVLALSRACLSNPNNGVALTPLDLIAVEALTPDIPSPEYQGSHTSSLAISSEGTVACLVPVSGANSPLQGSPRLITGGNLSPPPPPLDGSIRNARYGVPRAPSFPADEQQGVQYNNILSGRSIPLSSLPLPGAVSGVDCAVQMLPSSNGMGMMCGVNRNVPMSRQGLQGGTSSSMLNSGSMLASSMVVMAPPVNTCSGAGSGNGNSIFGACEVMHMMRPGQNAEHQRQMMVPESQMQETTQGNKPGGVPPSNGLTSAFSNHVIPSSSQTYPVLPQQHQTSPQPMLTNSHYPHLQGPCHVPCPQQQAYAIHMPNGRQLQQRMFPQQQLSASNGLLPLVEPETQIPLSASLQNCPQIQPQVSSHPVSLPPIMPSSPMTHISSQYLHKQQLRSRGFGQSPPRVAGALSNHTGKQWQQQRQQAGRQHAEQRQSSLPKHLKKMVRANTLMHQNFPRDPFHLKGLTTPPGSIGAEKGERVMQVVQSQGLYSGSGFNPAQPSKLLVTPRSSNQPQQQPKLYSDVTTPVLKHFDHTQRLSDNYNQGQVPPVPSSHALSSSHHAVEPSGMAFNHHQMQPQPSQKRVSECQSTGQRRIHQNHQVASDLSNECQLDRAQTDHQIAPSEAPVSVTAAMLQVSIDSPSIVPVVSFAGGLKPKSPREVGLSNPAAQLGSISTPLVTNIVECDPIASPVGQWLSQRQLSGSLSPQGHEVGAQWQQHPSSPTPQY